MLSKNSSDILLNSTSSIFFGVSTYRFSSSSSCRKSPSSIDSRQSRAGSKSESSVSSHKAAGPYRRRRHLFMFSSYPKSSSTCFLNFHSPPLSITNQKTQCPPVDLPLAHAPLRIPPYNSWHPRMR